MRLGKAWPLLLTPPFLKQKGGASLSWIVCCLLLMAAVFLTGCSGTKRAPVVIRFWNGFTGPDGTRALEIVRQFNRENPNIEVRMQRIEWGTYYNKLFVGGIGKRAPEVFVLHTAALRRFEEAGFVRPNDDLLADFPVEDLDANVWKAALYQGKHYGLPIDFHPLGLYYNRKLFRKAGIVDAAGEARPPRTQTEFLETARKLTKQGSSPALSQWGYAFSNAGPQVYSFMAQYNGKFFTPDLSHCLLNSPENVAALQFCVDLIQKEKVAPSPDATDPWIGFRQGRVAMTWNGIFMLPDLEKQTDLDFAGAPVAQVGAFAGTWAGSHNFCLKADLGAKEQNAAWRFIRFYSDHSLDWATAGQVPVRKSLRNSPRFAGMKVQSQFARQLPYGVYMPQIPFNQEFETEFNYAVEQALRGSLTPKEALDAAALKMDAVIARRREDREAAGSALP